MVQATSLIGVLELLMGEKWHLDHIALDPNCPGAQEKGKLHLRADLLIYVNPFHLQATAQLGSQGWTNLMKVLLAWGGVRRE